jgi:molybdopterin/thiamine biosynthesis adenylyltransferase
MEESLRRFLMAHSRDGLLPWKAQAEAAQTFSSPCRQIEEAALTLGLLPARYQRNQNTLSTAQQAELFASRVVVVGAGGLGGYVVEQLARLGVGTLVVMDPDCFEEHNLNRQILSEIGALGRPKVDLAAERVARINPAVTVIAIPAAFSPDLDEPLVGARVVVDALDSAPTRLALGRTCARLGVPLVHGAIAGWYGQVVTQLPGDDILSRLYPETADDRGAERQLGNPAFTPAVIASLQVAETCKLLLGLGNPLRGGILSIDLLDMEFDKISIG